MRLFHEPEDVTFEVDLEDDGNTIIIINYTIVKQGDELAPVLFLCYIQAVLETSFQSSSRIARAVVSTLPVCTRFDSPEWPPFRTQSTRSWSTRQGKESARGSRCAARWGPLFTPSLVRGERPSGAWSVDP